MKPLTLAAAAALSLAAQVREADALLCTPILGCTCTVTASDMAFGNVDPISGLTATATSDVLVQCTGVIDALPSVLAKIGPGLNGTIADRQMKDGANNRLHYNIYNASNAVLGEAANGYPGLTISGGVLALGGWTATEHMYGRAPAVASTLPGAYQDTVTVRIDW